MRDEDVKIGMKVIPYLKMGEKDFEYTSAVYMRMLKSNIKHLYVSRIETMYHGYDKIIYVLSNRFGESGDYFYSSDFELPVKLQRKQKLIKLSSINNL